LHKNSKIILGIDPGTLLMGFSVITVTGNDIRLVEMDVLKLSSKKDTYERLRLIHYKVCELVKTHSPHELAIEALLRLLCSAECQLQNIRPGK
jgi:crossover junction endodeoxyribonuclease RuvC